MTQKQNKPPSSAWIIEKTDKLVEEKMPKLRVMPVKKTKKEYMLAKRMEMLINYQYKQHKDFVDALTRSRILIEKLYGIKTIDLPWEIILQAYLSEKIK